MGLERWHEGGVLMRAWMLAGLLLGCNLDPGHPDEDVAYRDGLGDGEADSGERGNVKISEIFWSGSVKDDGTWDPDDVFLEIRNEGSRPVNLSGWFLELEGVREVTWRIPDSDFELGVGAHGLAVAKTTGCFDGADWVIPEMNFPYGDPIYIRLRDRDEHLIEPAGSREMPPYAGGYDLAVSRSMEKIELMFGGRGSAPTSWHHYTDAEVEVVNNDLIRTECQTRTLASPGRPNSPDYSGAFSSGSLE
jgi:hypothetical protein